MQLAIAFQSLYSPKTMLSRPIEPPINSKDPFKGDQFHRAELAGGLVKLLSKIEGPLTLAVTGPFGVGKTHFLNTCKVLLENKNVPVVMVNAWETDFASEPIAPLISELTEKFSQKLPKGSQQFRKIKGLAAKITAFAAPVGIKLVTAGVLDLGDLADAAQKEAEKQFERFNAARQSIHALRTELTALAQKIRPAGDPRPPVVVIIDELDRCRPTYSIELLEVVKHLFCIPGLVFVLGVDRRQLASSASAVFGQGLEADGYLRRFIDLECALPQPNVADFCTSSGYSIIRQTTGINSKIFEGYLLTEIGALCQGAGFSIRQTHQFLMKLGIAIAASARVANDPDAVALLTFLREWDEGLCHRFVTRRATSFEVYERIRSVYPHFLRYDSYSQNIPFLTVLTYAGKTDQPEDFLTAYRKKTGLVDKSIPLFDRLMTYAPNEYPAYLAKLAELVDFGAGFVVP